MSTIDDCNADMQNKNKPGYCWKLCPHAILSDYSIRIPNWLARWKDPSQRTDHTTTEGRMFMTSGPKPGFICKDDACWYYVNNSPARYIEV